MSWSKNKTCSDVALCLSGLFEHSLLEMYLYVTVTSPQF